LTIPLDELQIERLKRSSEHIYHNIDGIDKNDPQLLDELIDLIDHEKYEGRQLKLLQNSIKKFCLDFILTSLEQELEEENGGFVN